MSEKKMTLPTQFAILAQCAARELADRWEIDPRGFWVASDPLTGGVYCYDADIYVGVLDMFYCLREGVTFEEYDEWIDYCGRVAKLNDNGAGVPHIILDSWHKGAPRMSEEELKKLEQ